MPKTLCPVALTTCLSKTNPKNNGEIISNFHAITFRCASGVTDDQISALYTGYQHDLTSLEPNWWHTAVAGSFGVEGTGQNRHVHIGLVLSAAETSEKTKNRYVDLFSAECRREAIDSVQVCQPPEDQMDKYSALEWLAFPVKRAGDFADKVNRIDMGDFRSNLRSIDNIFEGLDEEQRRDAYQKFTEFVLQFRKGGIRLHARRQSIREQKDEDPCPAMKETMAKIWADFHNEKSEKILATSNLEQLRAMADDMGITEAMVQQMGNPSYKATYRRCIRLGHMLIAKCTGGDTDTGDVHDRDAQFDRYTSECLVLDENCPLRIQKGALLDHYQSWARHHKLPRDGIVPRSGDGRFLVKICDYIQYFKYRPDGSREAKTDNFSNRYYPGVKFREGVATEVTVKDGVIKSALYCPNPSQNDAASQSQVDGKIFLKKFFDFHGLKLRIDELVEEKNQAIIELNSARASLIESSSDIAANQTPAQQQIDHYETQLAEATKSIETLKASYEDEIQKRLTIEGKLEEFMQKYKSLGARELEMSQNAHDKRLEIEGKYEELEQRYKYLADINKSLSSQVLALTNKLRSNNQKRKLSPDDWPDAELRKQVIKRQKVANVWSKSPPANMNPMLASCFKQVGAMCRASYLEPQNIRIQMHGEEMTIQEFKLAITDLLNCE